MYLKTINQAQSANNTQQISGNFNGCFFHAEKIGEELTRLLVQYDQCIIALIENNRYEIKPFPNWRHTVNEIIKQVK